MARLKNNPGKNETYFYLVKMKNYARTGAGKTTDQIASPGMGTSPGAAINDGKKTSD